MSIVKRYKILVPVGDYKNFEYMPVMAEEFNMEGFGVFLVHRKIDVLNKSGLSRLYQVTCPTTKFAVPNSIAIDKELSKKQAELFLKCKGVDELNKARERAMRILEGSSNASV